MDNLKKMIGFRLFFLLAGFLWLAHGQNCPPREVLAPCTCAEYGPFYSCTEIADPDFNLKEVFDRASEFIGEDVIAKQLYISRLAISEIEDGTLAHLKVEDIFISNNRNLRRISPNAFPASWNATTSLHLSTNKLDNYFPREREIFELANNFPNLKRLAIIMNHITSVPANAFHNLQFLEELNLRNNQISQIGSRAFATGPSNLTKINLSQNSLRGSGLPDDAFEGISPSALVNLQDNSRMRFLGQKSYQGLLDRAEKVEVGAYSCGNDRCRLRPTFVCDARSDWICEREELYRPKIYRQGFGCILTGKDTWTFCAGRNNNTEG